MDHALAVPSGPRCFGTRHSRWHFPQSSHHYSASPRPPLPNPEERWEHASLPHGYSCWFAMVVAVICGDREVAPVGVDKYLETVLFLRRLFGHWFLALNGYQRWREFGGRTRVCVGSAWTTRTARVKSPSTSLSPEPWALPAAGMCGQRVPESDSTRPDACCLHPPACIPTAAIRPLASSSRPSPP